MAFGTGWTNVFRLGRMYYRNNFFTQRQCYQNTPRFFDH